MDLEMIVLSEVRERQVSYVRERQVSYITQMWNPKNDANELIYKTRKRLTDFKNKLMITKGERGGGGIN